MAEHRLTVSIAPHIRRPQSIRRMMGLTIFALLPSALFGVYQYGLSALFLLLLGIGAAVAAEASVTFLSGRPGRTGDLHAVLVGLMLAMMLPAGCPWWVVTVGAFMGILIGKMPFGSLGGSPLSPAIVGLLVILVSWPGEATRFVLPHAPTTDPTDTFAESPLQAIAIDVSDAPEYTKSGLFIGSNRVGTIGTTSPALLLLGGLFLMAAGNIRPYAPLGFLAGITAAGAIFHVTTPANPDPLFHLLAGMTFFGAFFLATETPSTPVTPGGAALFGILGGALAVVFRMTGMGFGSAAYAIIIMSLGTPLFDRLKAAPIGSRRPAHAR